MEKSHTLSLETITRAYNAGKDGAAEYAESGRQPESTIYSLMPFRPAYDAGWKRGLRETIGRIKP